MIPAPIKTTSRRKEGQPKIPDQAKPIEGETQRVTRAQSKVSEKFLPNPYLTSR